MGCAGSAPKEPIKPEAAEEAYAAAAEPKLAGQFDKSDNLYGIGEGSREFILEQLFDACDDDHNGSVDIAEYSQVRFRATLLHARTK